MTLPLQTPAADPPLVRSAAGQASPGQPPEPGDSASDGADVTREGGIRPALVVGLDLSLTSTGIATAAYATTITSDGHNGDTLTQRRARLGRIRQRIIGHTTGADLVVIEAPSYGSRGGSAHDRAGLWWLVVSALLHRGIAVIDVAPATRVKYATGSGILDRTAKDRVLKAAIQRLPIDVANNDEADAAWLCALGHDLLGQPLCALPAAHRKALDTVRPRLPESA